VPCRNAKTWHFSPALNLRANQFVAPNPQDRGVVGRACGQYNGGKVSGATAMRVRASQLEGMSLRKCAAASLKKKQSPEPAVIKPYHDTGRT
jgi:hypothetical protein